MGYAVSSMDLKGFRRVIGNMKMDNSSVVRIDGAMMDGDVMLAR